MTKKLWCFIDGDGRVAGYAWGTDAEEAKLAMEFENENFSATRYEAVAENDPTAIHVAGRSAARLPDL